MRELYFLLSFTVFFTHNLMASPSRVDNPVENIKKNCLAANNTFYTTGVEIKGNKEPKFEFNFLAFWLQQEVYSPTAALATLNQLRRKLVSGSEGVGNSKREKTINFLKEIVSQQKLNQEETLCFIKCAAANTISYTHDGNSRSKWGNVNTIFSQGEGVCTEFSRVFEYYAAEFNIKSSNVEGKSLNSDGSFRGWHSINIVKFEGSSYFLEPQNKSCTLYELD